MLPIQLGFISILLLSSNKRVSTYDSRKSIYAACKNRDYNIVQVNFRFFM